MGGQSIRLKVLCVLTFEANLICVTPAALISCSFITMFRKESLTWSVLQVYCDMSAAGGGWTLIASIHEDDINSKCSPNDKWSSTSNAYGMSSSYHNWDNLLTFGEINAATSADFKSPAFYSLKVFPRRISISSFEKENCWFFVRR